MAMVSIELDQELNVDRLISKVRFKRTRSVFANYTFKGHHGISDDILTRKWVIVLYKANRTLQLTTHDNVRSDVKSQTRQYRTDFLSQKLRRLSCRFYTDTLFAKDKSIIGNICAQIFTDRDFSNISYEI